MIELIIKQPTDVCLDGDVRINSELFPARNVTIDMNAGERIEVTATFYIDRLNVVAGYPAINPDNLGTVITTAKEEA